MVEIIEGGGVAGLGSTEPKLPPEAGGGDPPATPKAIDRTSLDYFFQYPNERSLQGHSFQEVTVVDVFELTIPSPGKKFFLALGLIIAGVVISCVIPRIASITAPITAVIFMLSIYKMLKVCCFI